MEQETTLDLKEIFEVVRKRKWIIISITAAAVIISTVMSFLVIKPTYQASTSIIIGKATAQQDEQINYNDVLMYQQLVKTYGEIAQSRVVAEETIAKLGENITPEQLGKIVTVTPQDNTQIMEVTAKSNDPEDATKIANTLSQCFIDEAMKIYPTGNVQIMDMASLPDRPISPKKKTNIAIAFFLGLMVSAGIVFLLEYLDNTIKTESDIEKYLGLAVIGVIPKNLEE